MTLRLGFVVFLLIVACERGHGLSPEQVAAMQPPPVQLTRAESSCRAYAERAGSRGGCSCRGELCDMFNHVCPVPPVQFIDGWECPGGAELRVTPLTCDDNGCNARVVPIAGVAQ